MARISRQEVDRVAALARLSLSDGEAEHMTRDLDRILGYVETLGELSTEGVEPTAHVMSLATPLREDRADEPLDPELAVRGAPEHEGSAFVVPKVIEGEEEG